MQSMETVGWLINLKIEGFCFGYCSRRGRTFLDNHVSAFNFANNNNIKSTAHAGEAKGPESIKETLKDLR